MLEAVNKCGSLEQWENPIGKYSRLNIFGRNHCHQPETFERGTVRYPLENERKEKLLSLASTSIVRWVVLVLFIKID